MSHEVQSMEPHSRLTRLTNVGIRAMQADPEYGDDVRCIILLDDGETGGIVFNGYEDKTDAMVDLLVHVRAVFRANGKDILIAPMNRG